LIMKHVESLRELIAVWVDIFSTVPLQDALVSFLTTPPTTLVLRLKPALTARQVHCEWPCLMNSGDDAVSVQPTSFNRAVAGRWLHTA
jgi:hypothetical protein